MNRYMIRPHDAFFEQFCYALFIKRYQLQTKLIENDSQPEELVDELVETNHSTSSSYPKLLILSTSEKLHYRQVEFVLRYHAPIKVKQPENYAHRLLFYVLPIS